MAGRKSGVQWTIDSYFPKESAKEQLATVTAAIEEDTNMTRQERRVLSSDVTKAFRSSSREGKKLSTYSSEFINQVLKLHHEKGKEDALTFARKQLGKELPYTTFMSWVSRTKILKETPEGAPMLNLKKRGRPVEMPPTVEKWIKDRLDFYLSKGVRITRLLTSYV